LRNPKKKTRRRIAPPAIFARLSARITLEAHPDGNVFACFDGHSDGLGKFSTGAVKRAQELRTGLPLGSFASDGRAVEKEIDLLVRRLARRGLLEYRLRRDDKDQIVIEPQISDYWPQTPKLGDADTIVLSRFAYLRRRGNEMVLESPRAGALFRICNPDIATAMAALSTPQKISRLRRQEGFPGIELLALLVDCQILFKVDAASSDRLRQAEGDDNLVLWDFHDLLFHTHSTEGRQANPLGGLYPHAGVISPLPAVRPRWPGRKSICANFRPRRAIRRPRRCCASATRHATSTTSNRSRSPSCHDFSIAPRAFSRDGKAGLILTTAVLISSTLRGRIRPAAVLTSSNSI